MDRRSLRCPARWWSTSVFWKARQQRSGDEPRERPQEKRGEARGEKRGASDVWISSRESPWLLECGPLGSRYIQVAQCRGSSSVYMYIYIYINIYPIYRIIYTYTTAQKFLNRSFDKREFFRTFFFRGKILDIWCIFTYSMCKYNYASYLWRYALTISLARRVERNENIINIIFWFTYIFNILCLLYYFLYYL